MKKVLLLALVSLTSLSAIITACQSATTTTQTTQTTISGKVNTPTATTIPPSQSVTAPVVLPVPTTTAPAAGAIMVKDIKGRLVEKPRYGGILVYRAADGNYGRWDPYVAPSSANMSLTAAATYDVLAGGDWSVDRSVNSFTTSYVDFWKFGKGWMMDTYEQPNPTTYIIHIKKGMTWHNKAPVNGREITSTDFKYSYDRQMGLGDFSKQGLAASNGFVAWLAVQEIKIVDKYTFSINLKYASPLFPMFLGCEVTPFIIPREVVDTYGNDWKWNQAVGSGPWMPSDYVPDTTLVFRKNPNYYLTDDNFPQNPIPYVDVLRILTIPDWSTSMAALRTGKISQLSTGVMDGLTIQKSNPELSFKTVRTTASALQVNNQMKPFSDVRVRKAMQMAVNMKEYNDTFLGGIGDNYPFMIQPDYQTLYTKWEDLPKDVQEGFTYNPEGAKKLLVEAGYPNGFKMIMPLQAVTATSDLMISYWEKIGITTERKILDPASYVAYIYGSEHQMVWNITYGNWMPTEILNYWYGGQKTTPWNFANVDDPVFNKMLDDIRAEPDPVKRDAMMKKAFLYGTSQFFYISRPGDNYFNFWQPWVKGYQAEARINGPNTGLIAARIWVDQDLKKKLSGTRD